MKENPLPSWPNTPAIEPSHPSDPDVSSALGPETLVDLQLGEPSPAAGGGPAVYQSLRHVFGESGILRGTSALLKLNQKQGFDCPSCAWPDPADHRSPTEFCENGAKATASETTLKRVDPDFFARYSVHDLGQRSEYWLELQGRLTHPMMLEEGDTHYRQVSWEDAFELIASELNALSSADDAIFYTSGRASNEAAFLYQLFARQFGTNNLPDCSNMCHESSGVALGATLGVGKGTVQLEDFDHAEIIIDLGHNPGTNHPRMLTTLQEASRRGAHIISVNPLHETGLTAFKHPQEALGMLGVPTPIAQTFHRVRINGDLAFLRGLAKALFALEDQSPGKVLDHDFLNEHTQGFETWKSLVLSTDWEILCQMSGLTQEEMEKTAQLIASSPGKRLITCWAMGLTQHRNAVATIQEIAHLHLMIGAVGRPGAGLCPVRGHSNVQGDRTMGIYEKMPETFLASLDQVFQFTSPRKHGHDAVAAIKAMHAEPGKVFIALGGNFVAATPDTLFTAKAIRNCRLTVQISTKLNRSHIVTGKRALILPCLGRSEQDLDHEGQLQCVTVEDSMSVVHASKGRLKPASPWLKSEPETVARMALATLKNHESASHTPWEKFIRNHALIRDHIEKVLPDFHDYNARVTDTRGFTLPNHAALRQWKLLPSGKATFISNPLSRVEAADDQLILQTLRSHDQFNTTIYGLNDRYRGISNERRVVFLNPEDMKSRGISPLQRVNLTSHWSDGTREARNFLAIPYDTPRGSAAAYFPEANVLVPVDSKADLSHTPTSKAVMITVAPIA